MRNNSGVRVASALGLFLLPFGRPGRRFAVLGVYLGLAGRFLRGAAHNLLDAHWERTSFLGADQRQREESEAWHRLAVQTGKESI